MNRTRSCSLGRMAGPFFFFVPEEVDGGSGRKKALVLLPFESLPKQSQQMRRKHNEHLSSQSCNNSTRNTPLTFFNSDTHNPTTSTLSLTIVNNAVLQFTSRCTRNLTTKLASWSEVGTTQLQHHWKKNFWTNYFKANALKCEKHVSLFLFIAFSSSDWSKIFKNGSVIVLNRTPMTTACKMTTLLMQEAVSVEKMPDQ